MIFSRLVGSPRVRILSRYRLTFTRILRRFVMSAKRKHDVATPNGPVSVFVNVDDVAVTFGPNDNNPYPYEVNGVEYQGTIYIEDGRLGQSFVNRVDDWTRGPTDSAWRVMIATAKNLAEEFYTTDNVNLARRELLEFKIESTKRKIADLADELAQLKNELRNL